MIQEAVAGARDEPACVDWAIRVASTARAGGGHVARCLTLACALADLGKKTLFILDSEGRSYGCEVSARGHSWVTSDDEPRERVQGCVIDGYSFGRETVRSWRERAEIMVAIADQTPLPDWADLTVAPGLNPGENTAAGQRVLAGLEYALVDPRYAAGQSPVSREVENILVSFGLRDSLNATGLTLQALDQVPEVRAGDIHVMVAMGASAPHLPAVAEQVKMMKSADCRINADMTACYREADLVIGGGGVSLLERMAQGLPSVSVVLAGNQARQIEYCARTGGTLNAGTIDRLDIDLLAEATATLLRSTQSRTSMSTKARNAVDGRGAARCAKIMRDISGAS